MPDDKSGLTIDTRPETLAMLAALWAMRPKRGPALSVWSCGRKCGSQIKCPTGLNRGCIYATSHN